MSKDPLFLTKLFGAALVTAWVGVAAVSASWALYKPGHIDKPAYPLLASAIGERPTAPGASGGEQQPPAGSGGKKDLPALLASADPKAGEKVARKCHACHTLDKGGRAKIGPNLWGVVGRDVASFDHFNYSQALSDLGGKWTYAKLNDFLTSPQKFAPGTKMTFTGVQNDSDRADLIDYLRTLSDNPEPLP